MDVSIVIVNWNTREILRNCLISIYQTTSTVKFEIIVIDNASEDKSTDMIRNEFPEIILIANKENKGFACANNQGIQIAKGRYVLLLNSDTIVLDDAIGKTMIYADQHKDAAVVGCKVLNDDYTLQPTCFKFPSLANLAISVFYLNKIFPGNRFFGREKMVWWYRDTEMDIDVVTGCFMFVRKSAIDQVGMMDEEYFMYGEETDWCYRFRKNGWNVCFTPNAEIIHLGGQSSNQVRPQMILQLKAGILQFFYKQHSFLVYKQACILISLWYAIRVIPWIIKGLINSNKHRKDCFMIAGVYLSGAWKSLIGWEMLSVK